MYPVIKATEQTILNDYKKLTSSQYIIYSKDIKCINIDSQKIEYVLIL